MIKNLSQDYFAKLEWVLGLAVLGVALSAWWTTRVPYQDSLDIYDIFPLFGLIAFSVMWTHFIFGALSRFLNVDQHKRTSYSFITMGIVLALLILHPLTLWWGLWRDGFGLPPSSYLEAYGTEPLRTAILLGSFAFSIFIAYEFKRFFGNRLWWKYVEYLQVVAMIAIFYHALVLGREVSSSWWFMAVWWFYGVTLVIASGYTYWYDSHKKGGDNASI